MPTHLPSQRQRRIDARWLRYGPFDLIHPFFFSQLPSSSLPSSPLPISLNDHRPDYRHGYQHTPSTVPQLTPSPLWAQVFLRMHADNCGMGRAGAITMIMATTKDERMASSQDCLVIPDARQVFHGRESLPAMPKTYFACNSEAAFVSRANPRRR